MARKSNDQRLDEIAQAIATYPNRKPGWIARLLGWDNKTVMRALPQLEDRGVLLVEDEFGRISMLGRRQ